MKLYTEAVPPKTLSVLHSIKHLPDLQNFYLSGGTALSIQLGHRESEDLDFFTSSDFHPQGLQQKLIQYGSVSDVEIDEGTLNLFLNQVKLQFLYYPYPLLEKLIKWSDINLSSITDIACTKLITISMRGNKKDFIDLYVILQQIPLETLFTKLEKKYKEVQYNYPHILKSLVYFDDADIQPMPKMHVSLNWEEVKSLMVREVKKIRF